MKRQTCRSLLLVTGLHLGPALPLLLGPPVLFLAGLVALYEAFQVGQRVIGLSIVLVRLSQLTLVDLARSGGRAFVLGLAHAVTGPPPRSGRAPLIDANDVIYQSKHKY